ncbi:hypothetical protein CI610_01445 [invertebrate metagenome]|uniref:DNA-binding protein n=1 Tax=invertebrate metagenome TaxID=1711999 RepID=A0A2H9T8K5_9ZZZZ
MQKKRFIAGAVCPVCQAQDTIRCFTNEQDTIKECVDCGYTELLTENLSPAKNLPTTPVTENEQGQCSKDIIRIINPYEDTK